QQRSFLFDQKHHSFLLDPRAVLDQHSFFLTDCFEVHPNYQVNGSIIPSCRTESSVNSLSSHLFSLPADLETQKVHTKACPKLSSTSLNPTRLLILCPAHSLIDLELR
ncbi:uncharacterized protein GLRG_04241, partial [Colletotrichum graminicola M1.001]